MAQVVPDYLGWWSTGKATQYVFQDGTITMEGGGDDANVLEYNDITPEGSEAYRLEVTKSTDEPFVGPFVELVVKTTDDGDEMLVKSYGSLADLEQQKALLIEETYFRDEDPNASADSTEAESAEAEAISGTLKIGDNESVILYHGEESGDYAAWCFDNDSDVGRRILELVTDGQDVEISGTIDHGADCFVPGLEADLSASGRILKVETVSFPGG